MLTVKEPSKYNKGNVNYELLLKNYSTITTFGYFNKNINFDEIQITSFEKLIEANGIISEFNLDITYQYYYKD